MFQLPPNDLQKFMDKENATRVSVKRAYQPATREDGYRILVDRLWPRGLSKADLQIEEWRKECAPSTELRKWFNHDPAKWGEFVTRYNEELKEHRDEIDAFIARARNQPITLIYSAKDEAHNQAVALKNFIIMLDH
jgi:uncharacterized protein YeaO (DUF488 family)